MVDLLLRIDSSLLVQAVKWNAVHHVGVTSLSEFVPPPGIYPKPHWVTDSVQSDDECDRFGLGTFNLPPCTNDNVVPPVSG